MTRQKQNPVVVKPVPLSSLVVRGPRRARPGLSGLVIGTILLLASLTGGGFAQAGPTLKVYKHVDENGVTHYSSKKPRGVKYSILRIRCPECTWKNKVNWHSTPLITDKFTDIIHEEAARAGFEPALIMAIIHAESGFKPNSVSSAGAQGLMQLMPATQKRFGVRSAFSPGSMAIWIWCWLPITPVKMLCLPTTRQFLRLTKPEITSSASKSCTNAIKKPCCN